MRPIVLAVVACSLFVTYDAARADSLEVYPVAQGFERSTTFAVAVNGVPVPVLRDRNRSYIHFGFSGVAHVTVTVSEAVNEYRLSPLALGLDAHASGREISFAVNAPSKLVLHMVNALAERLFIIADAFETNPPVAGNAGVYSVLDYGARNDGSADSRTQINQAISDVSSRRGTLYFPAGVYLVSGAVTPRSNMTIYLAPGACIRATARSGRGIIDINNASDLVIRGRGTIDANGTSGKLIWMQPAQRVEVEGIVLQRSGGDFHFRIIDVRNLYVHNLKLVGDVRGAGNDGIDPDCSDSVVIDDVVVYSYDDAISLKASGSIRKPVENITVRNSVFWNYKSCLKLGTESGTDLHFRNITWENNDIVQSDRAIVLYCGNCYNNEWNQNDNALYTDIYFRNIRIEKIGGETSWRLIDMCVGQYTGSNARIDGVYLQNITAREFSRNSSSIRGQDAQRSISNVFIDNFVVGTDTIGSAAEGRIAVGSYVNNLQFTTSDPAIVRVSGDGDGFVFSRAGSIARALTVRYHLGGSAVVARDYAMADSVVVPAGARAARIAPVRTAQGRAGSVALTLMHSPGRDFMVGTPFSAQVSLGGVTPVARRAEAQTPGRTQGGAVRLVVVPAGKRHGNTATVQWYNLDGRRLFATGGNRGGAMVCVGHVRP